MLLSLRFVRLINHEGFMSESKKIIKIKKILAMKIEKRRFNKIQKLEKCKLKMKTKLKTKIEKTKYY